MKKCRIEGCGGDRYQKYAVCWEHRKEQMKFYPSQTTKHRQQLPLRPERNIYYTMKSRCTNPNHNRYEYYGGRGIRVCDRWLESFDNFIRDMGARPSEKHSLERIDPNGDYEPGNVVWATQKAQARNKRLYKNNRSGFRGVSKRNGGFYVRIPIDGKDYHVGVFGDMHDAISARLGAEASLW